MNRLQQAWKNWTQGGGRRGERRSYASRGVAQGLFVAALTLIFLSGTGIVRGWGNRTLDAWFAVRSILPHDEGISPRVAILAIDDATRRSWNGRSFDAKNVGRALILLRRHGVAAVAVAVPDLERDFLPPAEQAAWQRDVNASAIAHLPTLSTNARTPQNSDSAGEAELPWANDASRRGHTAFVVDSDAHVRRVPLVLQIDGKLVPSLSLSTALQGLGIAPNQVALEDERDKTAFWGTARRVYLNGRSVAVEAGGAMLLNFWATPSDDTIANVAFAQNATAQNASHLNTAETALRWPEEAASSTGSSAPRFVTLSLERVLRQPSLLDSWAGRCVVIGVTDAQAAPQWTLAGGARVSEATIHAIAIDNLLSGETLEAVPTTRLWLLTVFLCVTVGGLVAARSPLWSGLVTGLALLAVALLSLGLFIQNAWLDVSLPCSAAAITFLQGVVSRARLQERETTRVSSTVEALERAGAIIAARGQSKELLERVLQWTLAAMGADAAIALVLDDDAPESFVKDDEPRFRVLAAVQRKPRALEVLPTEARDEIAARVTSQSQPMLIQDAHRDPRFRYGRSYYTHLRPLSAPGALNITSVIAAPLREGDPTAVDAESGVRTAGAILVLNRRDGTPFHPRDLELLTAVTNQASVALDNARLYEILNQRVARSESDLERTNRRLEAEKNTLQTVLESMTDGVVVTNNEGRVQILNPAARALLPELDDNVLGQTLSQCLPDVARAVLPQVPAQSVPAQSVPAQSVPAQSVPPSETAQNGALLTLSNNAENQNPKRRATDFPESSTRLQTPQSAEFANTQIANIEVAQTENANVENANAETLNAEDESEANDGSEIAEIANANSENVNAENATKSQVKNAAIENANAESATNQIANVETTNVATTNAETPNIEYSNAQAQKNANAKIATNAENSNRANATSENVAEKNANAEDANPENANAENASAKSALSARLMSALQSVSENSVEPTNILSPRAAAPNVSTQNISESNVPSEFLHKPESNIVDAKKARVIPSEAEESLSATQRQDSSTSLGMTQTSANAAESSLLEPALLAQSAAQSSLSENEKTLSAPSPENQLIETPLLQTALSQTASSKMSLQTPLLLPLSATTQIVRGDVDDRRVIEVRSAPLLSVEPKDAGIVWVFSDVTEEKSIEQAKSDFVSFVAHEMRSPLTSISGFSLMLQRMEKPDDESSTRNEKATTAARDKREKSEATRQRFLGVIHNESERLTRLINNLLDVARLEAGRDLGLNLETLDFAVVANEAIESQRVYSSRHVLANEVARDLPPLLADRDKVLQILINLLSNAMKYSPGGNITVSTRVESEFLVACVRDEGPGIAPEHRARLFERFGRIGTRSLAAKNPGAGGRAKPTGTGLGLFLTRHLVESHGGRIWLDESAASQGACFCFSLPLSKTESSTRSGDDVSLSDESAKMTANDAK